MRLAGLASLLMLGACAAAGAPPVSPSVSPEAPPVLLNAADIAPGLLVDMRYYGSENFTGRPVAGYEAPVCLLSPQAADALAAAALRAREMGFRLKVFDCYRPARAVADFAAWARDPSDQARKADYYPAIDKSRLFELGYIAERSGHSRGSTVDLTLVDAATGEEVDMGTSYDLFDTRSWPEDRSVSEAARGNRLRLQALMQAAGFRPLREEWWHFTLIGEPYPDTYLDVPVRDTREAAGRRPPS
jgi:D-alanyl-D-alanine dipeptidase